MQRTRFDQMTCPIARALDRVGEWWSMLVMRDVLAGTTRFDALQRKLGIAPNMLSRRLAALVEAGLLERRALPGRPPRVEDVPTARGEDLRPVLLALLAWGNRHFAPEGHTVRLVDARTGAEADPVLVDRATGRPVTPPDFVLLRTPEAPPAAGVTAGAARSPASPRRRRA